jgi:hypothetical protein
MTRFAILLVLLMPFVGGCADTAVETSHVLFADYDVFGQEFDQADNLPVQQVADQPSDFLGSPVKVSGTVTEVCQARGCWMTLQVSDAQLVRIVMPRDEQDNYLYTLDKGISGRRAIVHGTLDESTLAEFEAPMHADGESEGHHAEEGDAGPELHITASGVLVEKLASNEDTN